MKRNWTFKFAIQSKSQKKRVEIRKGSKTVPKTSEKLHSGCRKSIYPEKKSISCTWFSKNGVETEGNRLPYMVNRFPAAKNSKNSISKAKFLIKHFYKHLMIIDSIEHENSIKLVENSTNGITKCGSMNQVTKINKRSHHERWRSHLSKVDLELYQSTSKLSFKWAPRINHQSIDLLNWWRKSVWMEV